MKKAVKTRQDPDMLDEYDFSQGVRGKYAQRYATLRVQTLSCLLRMSLKFSRIRNR